MTIALILPNAAPEPWLEALNQVDSDVEVEVWPEVSRDKARLVATYAPPPGAIASLPEVRSVISIGHGVDPLVADATIPERVALSRVDDGNLVTLVGQYVSHAIVRHYRSFPTYEAHQSAQRWMRQDPVHTPGETVVAIMGLGQLGRGIAAALAPLGFSLRGWSRNSGKGIPGVVDFVGRSELEAFLRNAHYLVCALPITPETQGILSTATFEGLSTGAYLVHVGRGNHLNETDLLTALNNHQLSGACLDVFSCEPLPREHPFWTHEFVTVTPHAAGPTYPSAIAPQLVSAYYNILAGGLPDHVVDRQRGY